MSEEEITSHGEPLVDPPNVERARKATVTVRDDGDFGYHVQGANWVNIDASEEGFKNEEHVYRRLARRWPHMEALVLPDGSRLEGDELTAWIVKWQADEG